MKEKNAKIMTPVFRVSFPAVFQPKAPMNGQPGDSKYSITMLFDKTANIQPLKDAVRAAVVAKWGPDQAKWPTKNVGTTEKPIMVSALRMPFRKGEEKDYEGYGVGVVFASATSKQKPGLVDQDVQPIIDPSEFYGGCYAKATINAFAYDKAGNRGVAFGLQNIQKVKDGDAFSGKSAADKDFDAIAVPEGASKAEPVGADDGLGL